MVFFWAAFKAAMVFFCAAICTSKLSLSLSLVGACDLLLLVPALDERLLSLAAFDFILRESTTVPVLVGWMVGWMDGWIDGSMDG